MKTIVSILFLLSLGFYVSAQDHFSTEKIEASYPEKNVEVKKLCSDEHESSFIIWVTDTVEPHYHKEHTEVVLVLEGEGTFYMGTEIITLEKGDLVRIPKGTIHSFKNTGKKACKVLSIQAPEFTGKDRIWVEEQK